MSKHSGSEEPPGIKPTLQLALTPKGIVAAGFQLTAPSVAYWFVNKLQALRNMNTAITAACAKTASRAA